MIEYAEHDAVGLAELVAAGQVSAEELLDDARARARAANATVNAVVTWLDDPPPAAADGPLAGVPFLLKDLLQDIEGVPTSNGCRALHGVPAQRTATVVQRWLDAGLVVFGKTNTPEFGAKGVTEPELFGPCRNPWDTEHTCGGSSGGAAAAVAAGIVPAAGASDGGGSIRIPAACCGLFGLKVGRGLIPSGPGMGEGLGLWNVLERRQDHVERLAAFHADHDLLLTPTIATPPPRVGAFDSPAAVRFAGEAILRARAGALLPHLGIVDKMIDENLGWIPYTQLANLTGRPSMSVPLRWTPGGLPLGVQFTAALGGEALLLRLAAQLEEAHPWAARRPELHH